jgi:hypothetical protein
MTTSDIIQVFGSNPILLKKHTRVITKKLLLITKIQRIQDRLKEILN